MNIAFWLLLCILIVFWIVDAYKSRDVAIKETLIIILFALLGVEIFKLYG
jgi:hypothetical protein